MPFGRFASISSSGIVRGHDLGVDARLAHAAGDQLCVLRAEVDDEDGVVRVEHHAVIAAGQRPIPTPWRAGATCPRSAATARP